MSKAEVNVDTDAVDPIDKTKTTTAPKAAAKPKKAATKKRSRKNKR